MLTHPGGWQVLCTTDSFHLTSPSNCQLPQQHEMPLGYVAHDMCAERLGFRHAQTASTAVLYTKLTKPTTRSTCSLNAHSLTQVTEVRQVLCEDDSLQRLASSSNLLVATG